MRGEFAAPPLAGFLLAGLFLTGCATRPPPPPPHAPHVTALAACLARLDRRGVVYDRVADWRTPSGCGIEGAVRVHREALAWNRPALMSCPLAATLWDFETKVVRPAARRDLGRDVVGMSNLGAYACRDERSNDHPERLSQHALGQAIDISGFTLAGGESVTMLRDWEGDGAKARFLHDVARGACRYFSVVIAPDHNVFHRDHMHVDIGPYRLCGL